MISVVFLMYRERTLNLYSDDILYNNSNPFENFANSFNIIN